MSPPRAEDAVGEQACPECQIEPLTQRIVAEIEQQIETALANHRLWEDRTGWKLMCVLTRHAALHTQLTEAHAKAVGTAIENLTLHLKRISGSLALCPSRPDTYEQIVLWEKPSWDHFRSVMESLYSPQQLGEAWNSARNLNSLRSHRHAAPLRNAGNCAASPAYRRTCIPCGAAADRAGHRAAGAALAEPRLCRVRRPRSS